MFTADGQRMLLVCTEAARLPASTSGPSYFKRCDTLRAVRASFMAAQRWWQHEDALCRVAHELSERNFVVLDAFLGEAELVAALRGRCLALGASAHSPSGFEALTSLVDLLISELRQCADLSADLERVEGRTSFAVSKLAPGGSQGRHVDNPASSSTLASLTVVYYMQDHTWDAKRGGCLRVFRPEAEQASGAAAAVDSSAALADVEPVSDRLIVFFADGRCPHAVLPVCGADRYSAVLFYGPRKASERLGEDDAEDFEVGHMIWDE